eukprot:767141-Hanusia_phi.AAC.16
MSRHAFHTLLNHIRSDLQRSEKHAWSGCPNGPISPELQLSMTLRWLAGGSYLDIHHFHGVSAASFWKVKDRVLESIAQCSNLRVSFPHPHDTCNLLDREYLMFASTWSAHSEC